MSYPPPPGQQPPTPQQRYYQQQVQPEPVKEKRPKWQWVLGIVLGLGACGAVVDAIDGTEPEQEQVTGDTTETTEEAATTTAEVTTTTASEVEETQPEESTDEEIDRLAEDLAMQLLLDQHWPHLGAVNRDNPEAVKGIAEATCETLQGTDSDEEMGTRLLLTWTLLEDTLGDFFEDAEDYAEFTGLMAAYECPEVLD